MEKCKHRSSPARNFAIRGRLGCASTGRTSCFFAHLASRFVARLEGKYTLSFRRRTVGALCV
eukprot:scaffold39497_cov62-Phaeocystis_antarctica.AAC.7